MLNILSAIYVAVAAMMISNDADSIAEYQAERAQTAAVQTETASESVVSRIEDDYSDFWMN